MIFYASGAITDVPSIEFVAKNRIALLTSYAYKSAFVRQAPLLCKLLREQRVRLPYMVDSGAFTAWNKGKEVNRAALIDFYNWAFDEYSDALDFTFVSLDRIPGRQGVTRVAQDFLDAAKETVSNYEYLLRHVRGFVKPVYHDGEPAWVLRAYEGSPYISLSANLDMSYVHRESWVSEVSRRLEHKKLHGLAMTGTRMLRTARWHSVDSAAWVLWAGMGAIAWLRKDGSLKILASSKESPRRKYFDVHLTTLVKEARDEIVAAVEAEGFTLSQLQTNSIARSRWNMLVFRAACDWATKQPLAIPRYQEGLFDA